MKHSIITISREFGSGGRELAKRLADLLNFEYYDREIVTIIAERQELSETYVSNVLERGVSRVFPITVGRTLSYPSPYQEQTTKVLAAQQQVLRELAMRGDCVIVGQSADAVLKEFEPLNLFIYADMPSKIKRCRERAVEGEELSDSEMKKKIKQIDTVRAKRSDIFTDIRWGQKERYHLCINTTGLDIKALAPTVASYAAKWFDKKGE